MPEYRQDLVSGEWVIMAPERAKRPHELWKKIPKRQKTPKSECPFEDLKKTGNWPPILSLPRGKKWEILVLPNKYPAVQHLNICAVDAKRGPYSVKSGIGAHDVVLLRDHNKPLADLTLRQATNVLLAIRDRYRMFAGDPCLSYVIGIHNWGPTAGASLYHPHLQILTLLIIPYLVKRSLRGSHAYFKKHGRCAHCDIMAHEKKHKGRIVAENAGAIAICPFVSWREYEVRIFPKKHQSNYEDSDVNTLKYVADILQKTLRMMRKNLHDPDLNFYLHGAPLKEKEKHYHWHIELVPNVPPTPAGFELGTGIEITTTDPDFAAAVLRGRKK
ncbi:MAG: hypothetical protein V1856_02000 [Candidatus Liptonbacteria bacterium]